MRGLMMHRPLLVSSIIEHAADQFGQVDIVSRETHGPMFRYTYAECAARSRKLANALRGLGLERGAVVGTLAWNQHRHVEAYYGISGGGMVIHTCNPRLHPEQLIYIINHAEDRVLLFDPAFATLIQAIAPRCPRVQAWVCLSDDANLPLGACPELVSYEAFIDPYSERFAWPEVDEQTAAALCYTSGTTGNPKGVCFTHRAIVLNAITICLPNVLCLSPHETILPVVPLFHVNGWSIPYGALVAGARLVLPGPRLDGASLCELFERERVTVSAGVPTVWFEVLQSLDRHGRKPGYLKRIISGGSAIPIALVARFTEGYGIEVRQGWGMTETVAVATMSVLEPAQRADTPEARHAAISKQGKAVFGVEIKVVADDGKTLPRDGVSQGELLARGQWIASGYYKSDATPLVDGWFPTGDIATIDADGVMQIRDRAKDLIKTGGEWISSLDLENAAAAHPAVAAVAVIGVPHPKWLERPLMFIVCKPDHHPGRDDILAFVAERVARWWVPDDIVFLQSLPVGGTGKVQKTVLRERYGDVYGRVDAE